MVSRTNFSLKNVNNIFTRIEKGNLIKNNPKNVIVYVIVWLMFHSVLKRLQLYYFLKKGFFNLLNFFSEPPPTPDNLTVVEITSQSVRVSWTLEITSPTVDRIVIQWKEQSGL
jgi:hypothetical protein